MANRENGASDSFADLRLHGLMERAGEWAFELDAEDRIIFCHKTAGEWDTATPEDLIGKRADCLLHDGGKEQVRDLLRSLRERENTGPVRAAFMEPGGPNYELEAMPRSHDGRYEGCLMFVRNRPIQPDIGPMGGIIKNHPGIIWQLDNHFNITLCEGMTLGNIGVDPATLVGRNVSELDSEDYPFYDFAVKTLEQGPQTFAVEVLGRYLTCNTNPLTDSHGNSAGQMGIAQDITEIRETQLELEQASNAKSEFLSRMSHEIRTPMNAIIGMNSIARKSNDIGRIRYCLDKIEGASKQLLGLINDILDMSKIEANKFEISDNEFDFEKMLQNVCNVINVRIEEKHQHFSIDFDDIFLSYVICDELRLSQVMINLLTNAVKFTPDEGRITLKIRHSPVDDEISRLRVEVQDNGIGITEEQMDRLFTSFEQADGSTTRKFGGTGLGLAICKRIVGLMGGDIWVESEPGKGSSFIFEVNIRWGDSLIQALAGGDIDASKIRILTVDDHEDARIYFSNILDNFHLRNDVARDGEEALSMVRRAILDGDPYNLIFMDWEMPGMNGMETSRKIKSIGKDKAVVILTSVADWSDLEQEALKSGISRFLPKPVMPSMLFNTIRDVTEYPMFTESQREIQSVERDGYHWQNRRILLAEDIEINKEIILSILEETGVQVDWAQNGREALELFTAAPESYDLILMDIQMPELDGLQATRMIRESGLENSRVVPVIAMTANAFKEDVERCLAAGMDDHIAKPISLEELMLKLDAVLS